MLTSEQFLQNRFESLVNFFQLNRGLGRDAAIQAAIPNAVNIFGGRSEGDEGNLRYIPEARVSGDFNGDGAVGDDEFRAVNTNWQDAIFRNATTQQYSLSARGGNEKTRFFATGRYVDDEGQVIASEFEQYGLRLNLDHTASDFAQFEAGVNLSNSNLPRHDRGRRVHQQPLLGRSVPVANRRDLQHARRRNERVQPDAQPDLPVQPDRTGDVRQPKRGCRPDHR